MEAIPYPKYELFAKFLANGKPIVKAYVLAGYKDGVGAATVASKLLKRHPEILARAATLRNERAEDLRNANIIPMNEMIQKTSITQASLIQDLITFRNTSKGEATYLHATNLIAQYLGFDKPMATTISSNMTDQELVEDVNAMINKMGGKPILLIEENENDRSG